MVTNFVGPQVKLIREEQGFSQAAFAQELDIARTTLASWETGKRSMDAEALARAAVILGKHPAILLGYDPNTPADGAHTRLVNLLAAEGCDLAANHLGVSLEAMAAVRYGKLLVPAQKFEKLADAYNISYEWLRTGSRRKWQKALRGNPAERLRFLRILTGIEIPGELYKYWTSIERSSLHFRSEINTENSRLNEQIIPWITANVAISAEILKALASDRDNPPIEAWNWVVTEDLD